MSLFRHSLFGILLLLASALVMTAEDEGEYDDKYDKIIEVTDALPHVITSPHFPDYCYSAKYKLINNLRGDYHWRLLFTDLDIPPGSQLMIFGIEDEHLVPLDAASYIAGQWVRPVISYSGKVLEVHFNKSSISTKNMFVGFKASFWLHKDPDWQLDKPFTVCPVVSNTLSGGKVEVKKLNLPFDSTHYRYYCVWQLKSVPSDDLQIYVSLDKLDFSDGQVKIYEGVHSGAPLIYSQKTQDALPKKFMSKKGFYVELAKPADEGEFSMSYGVSKSLMAEEDCVFNVDGKKWKGFKCHQSGTAMCIPEENTCNTVFDCPDREDEAPQMCTSRAASLATEAPKPKPTPNICPRGRCKDGRCPIAINEKCPDEDCELFQRRCPGTLLCISPSLESCPGEPCTARQITCKDGSCVGIFQSCPDGPGCYFSEKRCRNGLCMPLYQGCPEDGCPSYEPFQCDGKCFYESVKCDTERDCIDGLDEIDCGWSTIKKFWMMILILPVAIICSICSMKWKRHYYRTGNCCCDETETDEGRMQMQAVRTAGASTTSTTYAPHAQTYNSVIIDQPINDNSCYPTAASAPPASEAPPPPSYNEVMSGAYQPPDPPPEDPPSYRSVQI